ncbi:hypothetical protein CLIB1423_07S06040 [[Candida] railenensis]|uniref:AMP-activated protein kinase glycogen-binding domain-containing protein n=1 Tax=[Candida] railenensis TaxID=45579 RepID=A0A9P0VYQ1_9ASCO|nr:hypothetical protein CLIB1423_07S06040 [[Candida] railenensis]
MTYSYRFKWPAASDIQSVHITGTFDNWSKTNNPLKRDGDFFVGTINVPSREKLVFKFVINEESWVMSPDYKIETDASGNENNYVDETELEEVSTPTPTTKAAAAPSSSYALPKETGKVEPASITSAPIAPVAASKESNTAEIAVPPTTAVTTKEAAPVTTTAEPVTASKIEPEPIHAPKVDTPKATEPAITQAPQPSVTTKAAAAPPTTAGPTPLAEESVPSTQEQVYSPSPEPADSVASPLTQVLTTTSSFAGVSLPSQDSVFEHLEDTEIEEDDDEEEDEDADFNQFNTPTNSLFNSGVLNSPNTTKGDSPLRNKNHKDNVEILQAPGAFPTSSSSSSTNQATTGNDSVRKDGLVSRFKSLFRY